MLWGVGIAIMSYLLRHWASELSCHLILMLCFFYCNLISYFCNCNFSCFCLVHNL